jgi:hypothetical protein
VIVKGAILVVALGLIVAAAYAEEIGDWFAGLFPRFPEN